MFKKINYARINLKFWTFIWCSQMFANVISGVKKPIDFWLRKGRQLGKLSRPRILKGVRRYNFYLIIPNILVKFYAISEFNSGFT